MEYVLIGIAGIAVFFLIIFLMYNRKQEIKIKRNIKEIKKIQTGSDSFDLFE